jgi:hypothetical protein
MQRDGSTTGVDLPVGRIIWQLAAGDDVLWALTTTQNQDESSLVAIKENRTGMWSSMDVARFSGGTPDRLYVLDNTIIGIWRETPISEFGRTLRISKNGGRDWETWDLPHALVDACLSPSALFVVTPVGLYSRDAR